MNNAIVIAIDGPSASGKGTCGRYVAGKLGFAFVDTGAMYRTLTWYCLEQRVPITDQAAILATCRSWPAALARAGDDVRLEVAGYFPRDEIRSDAVSNTVADVSPVAGVRLWMVRTQRDCLRFGDLVMDGRDIGTHVFPETPFKFFLTASDAVRRARRRAEGSGDKTDVRDRKDQQRTVAPLEPARDAVVIDNSHESPTVTGEFLLAHFLSRRRLLGL